MAILVTDERLQIRLAFNARQYCHLGLMDLLRWHDVAWKTLLKALIRVMVKWLVQLLTELHRRPQFNPSYFLMFLPLLGSKMVVRC